MKIPPMIAAELRRLTSTTMSRVALIALVLVPILYGGLYLWANQNPYDKLDQIPVALIVDDTGVTIDGTHSNFGDQVAEELLADGTFAWHRVSAETAEQGVDDSRYDFSVTLPADFSEALASAQGDSPRQATVILTTNDANSYLASTIGEQAAKTIQTSIVQKVNQTAATQLLTGLSTIRTQLVTAVDGGTQLVDGTTTAADGASQLAAGNAQLASGSATLRDGLGALASSTASLPSSAAQLADGAAQVAAGNAQLAQIGDRIGADSQGLVDALPTVRDDIRARLVAAGLAPERIDEIMAALDPIGTRIDDANSRVQGAVADIDTLAAGSGQVADGTRLLAEQTPALVDGIAQAQAGANLLADGAAQADTGAAELSSGLAQLQSGTTRLRDGLQQGVDGIPSSDEATRALQAQTISDPVQLETSAVTQAGTYGAGLAPFFVALAAWIGIYALFLIVKPVSRRAITALHSPIKVTLAGWLTPGLLGIVQMAALFFVVAGALHFAVDNPIGTFLVMALASLTFAAIILALNVWLGSVGQFLGLVLMVLQLVTAGGTFPWQTLPGPLAALHHVLPMGFAVDAIRQLMYGGNMQTAVTDAGVLLAWLVIALLVAAIGVTRMTHFRTLRDLQPSLIG
ncbi:YhgE/Pip domain-containing protein [Compostimonas suwonensis]|uniref:Putative membrane protein n=1 Tax=Compostimonas suwonensis TaxID=1048394 RepID=A0A2M9C4N6_9MICO|nr:YhgE/Pip domain-containing protein [Compostimonas suwonensis]PJJ65459.1 putative membrane protein [Compostimonas suwonensis]